MNKKFLSAILFGALMVTSTGTFVSCKDYDDDIDNINKELTDVKSQLVALQNKVDAGNYVTNITKAEGGINVAFSNGSTNFVATGAVVETEECYESAATIVDGEWVINKADGTPVETGIPASGVLVTGSEATGFVLSVVNAAGEITEVKLPTAASTLQTVVPGTKVVFTGNGDGTLLGQSGTGILWAKAAKNDSWAGSLGAIATDQFLVGQILGVDAKVTPATYDLSAQTLGLVDNQENEAAVVVSATPASAADWLTTGSRATSKSGDWKLNIELTSDVTAANVATKFAAGGSNKLYALTVNGKVVTDYCYVIDTGAAATSTTLTPAAANVKVNNAAVGGTYDYGKSHTVTYTDPTLADAYLSFADAHKAAAELAGVTVDGMTITAPATAANKTITFTVNLLDIHGTAKTQQFSMTFKPSTVESTVTMAATYTLTADASKQYIDINVADFFKNMTAAQVAAYVQNNWSLTEVADQENFLLSTFTPALYSAKTDGTIDAAINPASGDASVTKVAYIRIPVTTIASDAKPGDYNFTLKLWDANTNEIKKGTITVTIALPVFTDLYTASAAWEGSTFTTKILKGSADYYIDLSTAYNFGTIYTATDMIIKAAKVDDKEMIKKNTLDAPAHLMLNTDIIKDAALRTSSLTATASYKFYGLDELEVKSEEFTIALHSQFEAPKLVYYVDGVAKDAAVLGADKKVKTLYTDANGNKQGLAIQYAKGEQAFETGVTVDGVKLTKTNTGDEGKVMVVTSIKDVAAGSAEMTASTETTKGYVTVSETKGTLVAKFTDVNGIVTSTSIAFSAE